MAFRLTRLYWQKLADGELMENDGKQPCNKKTIILKYQLINICSDLHKLKHHTVVNILKSAHASYLQYNIILPLISQPLFIIILVIADHEFVSDNTNNY